MTAVETVVWHVYGIDVVRLAVTIIGLVVLLPTACAVLFVALADDDDLAPAPEPPRGFRILGPVVRPFDWQRDYPQLGDPVPPDDLWWRAAPWPAGLRLVLHTSDPGRGVLGGWDAPEVDGAGYTSGSLPVDHDGWGR